MHTQYVNGADDYRHNDGGKGFWGKHPKFRLFCILLLVFIILCVAGVTVLVSVCVSELPELSLSAIRHQNQTTFLYDGNGNEITECYSIENRQWVELSDIPIDMQNAIVAVEDKRFWTHHGVDLIRILGALKNNLLGGSLQGGSTLTQQLVKNVYLTGEQKLKRKIQEAYIALELERKWSKEDILEAYLNTIYLAGSDYGIKAAAEDYFGKEVSELTLRECAILASISKNPAKYSPRTCASDSELWQGLMDRADTVLALMRKQSMITENEYQAALVEEITVNSKSSKNISTYTEYVISEVCNELVELYGWEDEEDGYTAAQKLIYTGGFKIYTALDATAQGMLEDTVYNWENYPASADGVVWSDEVNGIPNVEAAAVIMDQHTGMITAMVGSSVRPTAEKLLNRAKSAVMLGSTIKPLAVYGPAIEAGAGGGTILNNIPVTIGGWDAEQSYPENYGGGGYTGPVTLRTSLQKSLNVTAAQLLVKYVGFENARNKLLSLGFSENNVELNGSNLALGVARASMIQETAAYCSIANGGIYYEPTTILYVTDSEGNVIIDNRDREGERVFERTTVALLNNLLINAVQYGTGTAAQIDGVTVAGKTGTNTDFMGALFAGYTADYTSCVWVGTDNGSPLADGSTGSGTAAPIWQSYMSKIVTAEGVQHSSEYGELEDEGLVCRNICCVSGSLATDACTSTSWEWFVGGTEPTSYCDQHCVITVCSESGLEPSEYCPEECITTTVACFIPSDSPYRWLGNSVYSYIANANLNYTSASEYKSASHTVCNVHTLESMATPEPEETPEPGGGKGEALEGDIDKKSVWDLIEDIFGGDDDESEPTPTPELTPVPEAIPESTE